MPEYVNGDHVFLESVIVACGGFFFVALILFLCAGKKKKKSKGNELGEESNRAKEICESPNEVVTSEVSITVEGCRDEPTINTANIIDVEAKITGNPAEEPLGQYDPELRRSQICQEPNNKSISSSDVTDPYETIGKSRNPPATTAGGTSDDKAVLKENNSTSGSENSDSSGGHYSKVKNVPKKEEIAYAVVDIKDSQEKYETLNGEVVRKQIRDSFEEPGNKDPEIRTPVSPDVEEEQNLNENITELRACELPEVVNLSRNSSMYESVADKKSSMIDHDADEENSKKSSNNEIENNRNSSLYASVTDNKKSSLDNGEGDIARREEQDVQPSSLTTDTDNTGFDEYAVVVKPNKKNLTTTATEEKEEEKEGYDGSGLYAAVSSEALNLLASTPPPPPPPPLLPPHPKNMIKRRNVDPDLMYEPISDNSLASDSLKRDNTYDSISDDLKIDLKKKQKKETHNKEGKPHHDAGNSNAGTTTKSSKKLFRGNMFKHSKKYRKSTENIDIADVSSESNDSTEGNLLADSSSTAESPDKMASLPLAARKYVPNEKPSKRQSLPHIPPPLPSVDKLKHLAEHSKGYRTSSVDSTNHLIGNRTSSVDNWSSPESSPKSSPRTPSSEIHGSLHGYRFSPNTTRKEALNVTRGGESFEKEKDCEEEDTYSTIKESRPIDSEKNERESETVCFGENDLEEEDKYATVKDEGIRTSVQPQQSSSEVITNGSTAATNGNHQLGEIGDVSDYAMVDFTKKHLERRTMSIVKEPVSMQPPNGETNGSEEESQIRLASETDDDSNYESVENIVKHPGGFRRQRSDDSDYMLVE